MLVIPMAPALALQIEHMIGCSICILLHAAVVENLVNYVSRLLLPNVTKRTLLVVWTPTYFGAAVSPVPSSSQIGRAHV